MSTTKAHALAALASVQAYIDGTDTINGEAATAPVIADPPAPTIALPFDTTAGLSAFYGPPIEPNTRGENALKWFNFPRGTSPRLYSRNGVRLTDHDGDNRPDHRAHRDIVEPLQAALQELLDHPFIDFDAEGLHIFAGCWNYRRKTGGRSFSTHAWGISIDLNPGENPWRRSITTFSDATFDTFEKHGFLSAYRAWGHDAMHFQRARFNHIAPGSYYAENGLPSNIVAA